jgi:hypothetical protein
MRRRLLMQKTVEKDDGWNYIMCKLNVTTTSARTTVISTSFTGSSQIDYITFNEPDNASRYSFATGFQFTWTGERIMYIHFKPNVTNLENLFSDVSAVTYIDMNTLDTRYVTTMSGMCANCPNLVQCLMSNCRADNLQYMINTFNSCSALKYVDFGSYITGRFKPKKLVDIRNMFNWCRNLTTINMSMFDLSNCTLYGAIFAHCFALVEIYLNTEINANATITTNMFEQSSAANAKLYYNYKKHDYSKIQAVMPSNWSLVNYNY